MRWRCCKLSKRVKRQRLILKQALVTLLTLFLFGCFRGPLFFLYSSLTLTFARPRPCSWRPLHSQRKMVWLSHQYLYTQSRLLQNPHISTPSHRWPTLGTATPNGEQVSDCLTLALLSNFKRRSKVNISYWYSVENANLYLLLLSDTRDKFYVWRWQSGPHQKLVYEPCFPGYTFFCSWIAICPLFI